jgi:methylmalonyl-CoA/ethylmalonyl-CoA epimerase
MSGNHEPQDRREASRMTKIDHIGIAVKSIANARPFYEALGLTVLDPEEIPQEQVLTAMIPVEDSQIELLEPLSQDSPVGRFLSKHGEGMHHLALPVEDISATLDELKAKGVRLVSDDIQIGAGGHLYFFVHPSSAGGVLLEICHDAIADV